MANSKIKFILASTSPRRRELIGHLKVPFTVLSKNTPEESPATNPVQFCADIAAVKGQAVFDELRKQNTKENYFIVSADTIVELDGKIYGKPVDVNEARQFLSELSGRAHSVFTAVAVISWINGVEKRFSFVEESKVTFAAISDSLMENYLATGDSLDKAGAYGIQNGSLSFISKVEGCYANVVGFPLSRFVTESEKFFKQHLPSEDVWFKVFA